MEVLSSHLSKLERDMKRKASVRNDNKTAAGQESAKSPSSIDVRIVSMPVISPIPSSPAVPPVPLPSSHTSKPNAIASLESKFG